MVEVWVDGAQRVCQARGPNLDDFARIAVLDGGMAPRRTSGSVASAARRIASSANGAGSPRSSSTAVARASPGASASSARSTSARVASAAPCRPRQIASP